jgi:hypothetical protein
VEVALHGETDIGFIALHEAPDGAAAGIGQGGGDRIGKADDAEGVALVKALAALEQCDQEVR